MTRQPARLESSVGASSANPVHGTNPSSALILDSVVAWFMIDAVGGRQGSLGAAGRVRMRRALGGIALVLVLLLVAGWPAVAAPGVRAAAKAPANLASQVDFNGDGYDDLAVGVPGEDVDGQADAGVVQVLYGSANGLTGTGQLLTQASPEAGDRFGTAVAKGDFNVDGFTDLAVGTPGETLGGAAGAGAVNVFDGSASGLPATSQVLYQANREAGDRFGAALAAGPPDDEGNVFLAVGAPGETLAGADTGVVNVFYRYLGVLSGSSQVLVQANPEAGDRFGAALSSDRTYLLVGAPGEDVGGTNDAGAVNLFESVGPESFQVIGTSRVILQPNPEAGDQFGAAVMLGNFSASGADYAVGAPGEDVGGTVNAGAVNVFYFSAGHDASQALVQGPGTGGLPEPGDRFGASLAVGSFAAIDAPNPQELVVGAPGEDVGSVTDAGAINLLYDSANGLVGRNQLLVQGSPGVAGLAEAGDGFGSRLASPVGGNDFNGDGVGDLAIGVGGEDVGAVVNAGAVNVVDGAAGTGLPGGGGRLLTQDSPGVGGQAEAGDTFASALD